MAKLYPPVIEGTIPAFYGTTLVVPFSMNRAVAKSDIKGFSLKIKTVQTNSFVKNLTSTNYDLSQVSFSIEDVDLVAGQYYKLQLAYIANDSYSTIGYYSTVGVIKYYGETGPKIYVDGLSAKNTNIYAGSYLGIFEHPEDPMEKVAQYRFIIQESSGEIVTDTDWITHNTINDINSLSSNDLFKYDDDLDPDKVYYLYYKVKTSNNMECSTPGYRILQKNSVGLGLDITLDVENHYDNGYISVKIAKGEDDNITLTGSFEISRQNIENPRHWEPIFLFVLQAERPGDSMWRDFTIEQGKTYRYSIRQFNASGMYSARIISDEIYADFEDAFLFDGQRQLKIRYNPKVSSFKNDILESKTDTIGSKYPFIFRNGHVNYKEFPISGLISYWSDEEELFLSNDKLNIVDVTHWSRNETEVEEELPQNIKTTDLVNYNIAAERTFKLEVLEWLTNGKPKLFRSPGEGNYIVRLLNTSMTPTDSVGRMLHTFNCMAYEINEINYNTLTGYGFVKSELTDEESKKVYYRSVPLGWQGVNGKNYSLTYDETPKIHKDYYYYVEDELQEDGSTFTGYKIFNRDNFIEEEALSIFEGYKNDNNLFEIEYEPIITGRNKQYPVDGDGYVELLTNPYNKDETIKALTIRFDDMSSSDIIYVNGEKRMIGGTGVYNLDNGDEIYSVKVRTVADYYKDDYEADYADYLSNIDALKTNVADAQKNVDDESIKLEDKIYEINTYISHFEAPDDDDELIQAINNADEHKQNVISLSNDSYSLSTELKEKKLEKQAFEEERSVLIIPQAQIIDKVKEVKKEIMDTGWEEWEDWGFDPNSDSPDNIGDGWSEWTNEQWDLWRDSNNWAGNVVDPESGLSKWETIIDNLNPIKTLGVGGDVTSLPATPVENDIYKVITEGEYDGTQYKVDDLIAYVKLSEAQDAPIVKISGERLKLLYANVQIKDYEDKINKIEFGDPEAESEIERQGIQKIRDDYIHYGDENYPEEINEEYTQGGEIIRQKIDEVAERTRFVEQISDFFENAMKLRVIQQKFAKINTILKDLKYGDKLGLDTWTYTHKFDAKRGHYFVEKGTSSTADWKSTPIKNALAKLNGSAKDKKGLAYVQSLIAAAQKPLKEADIPESTIECNKKIEELAEEKEKLDKELEEKINVYTDEELEDLASRIANNQIETTKYTNYLVTYKNEYKVIDDYLEQEEKIKDTIDWLKEIEKNIKPLFVLPDSTTVKNEDLILRWKYFFEDNSDNFNTNKNVIAIDKKPSTVKFETTKRKNVVGGGANLPIREPQVTKEDFDKDKVYLFRNKDLQNIWDIYTKDEWKEGLYETNSESILYQILYIEYSVYQDIYTCYEAINLQKNTYLGTYFEVIQIKEKYENALYLINKQTMYQYRITSLERSITNIKEEIIKLCKQIKTLLDRQKNEQDAYDEASQKTAERIAELKEIIEELQGRINEIIEQKEQVDANLAIEQEIYNQAVNAIETRLIEIKNAGLEELRQQRADIEKDLNDAIIELRRCKNQLTNYMNNEEPDRRNYLYGDSWDNDILNDYDGLFTYSYIDNYNNTFDAVIGQNLLDVPCKQYNSFDTTQNAVDYLSDSRTEIMNILQIQSELKQVENIYLLSDVRAEEVIKEGQSILPEDIKNKFSLDKVSLVNDDDLRLIENPVYIYQIFPVLNHPDADIRDNYSGILFGFVTSEDNKYNSGSSKYNNYIRLDIAENEESADWHAPVFLFAFDSKDENKYYPITFFSADEFDDFIKKYNLYNRNADDVMVSVWKNAAFDDQTQYYTRGKEYMHVTYSKNELYYSDIAVYKIIIGSDGNYYLDTTNAYYNFLDEKYNGYFLVYDIENNSFKITKGYSTKLYINTGIKDATLGTDGQLYNGDEILQPYLDLGITQEFKTELIPQLTDLYVGNGLILNLSYHARQVDYAAEGNNPALQKAKAEWEKAIEEYTNYFYTKLDIDSYSFTEQTLYWDNLFRTREGFDEVLVDIEQKRQNIKAKYAIYLDELQRALDAQNAQRSWENYQGVSNNG